MMIDVEDEEENKICPWDYGVRSEEDDEIESNWSDINQSIDCYFKRPGGTILRFYHFIFRVSSCDRGFENQESLPDEENMISNFMLQRLESKTISHILSIVKRLSIEGFNPNLSQICEISSGKYHHISRS